jgi:hypothetical protein
MGQCGFFFHSLEKPRHGDTDEHLRVLPLGEVLSEILELLFEATFAIMLERGLCGDICKIERSE